MNYYAVFLPMKDEEKSQTYRADHLSFLEKMRSEKIVLMNGRFVDGAGGLVIYQASSMEEVEAYVNKDPYIIEGARGCEIHEWDLVTAFDLPTDK